MSKRFTDTEKWFDEWFRTLPVEYKLFWVYLCDRCNNAGVWKIDKGLAGYVMGTEIDLDKAAELFGDRIQKIRPGYWFIRSFIHFQFGELSPTNRFHASVLSLIKKEGASKALKRAIQGDKDKDMDKDKEPLGGSRGGFNFEALWARYPRKLGKDEAFRHFKAQVKTPKDYADMQNAMDHFLQKIQKDQTEEKYIPHGATWFNNRWRDWIDYTGGKNGANDSASHHSLAIDAERARAIRRAAGLRKVSEVSARSILAGVRGHAMDQAPVARSEHREPVGERNRSDG